MKEENELLEKDIKPSEEENISEEGISANTEGAESADAGETAVVSKDGAATEAENSEAETAETEAVEETESLADSVKALSPGRLVLKRFFRSKLSIVGLVMIAALFLFSFIGPLFSPWGETEVDYTVSYVNFADEIKYEVNRRDENGELVYDENGNVVVDTYVAYEITEGKQEINRKAPPSAKHWLGTDDDGMDVLTRIMYGGRISLTISFLVVFLEVIIGILMGGLAGYFGGWVDIIIMRIVDILSCLPDLPILLIVGAVLDSLGIPSDRRIYFMMAFLTFFGWTGMARLVRGQILSLREQEFMVSATARGLSTRRKIFRHLIPNIMPQLIVSMTLGLGSVILTESSLSYLDLGVPPPFAAWGSMIGKIKNPIYIQLYPWIWIPPGLCIVLAVLGFNFVGDGLRDAFDPKSRR